MKLNEIRQLSESEVFLTDEKEIWAWCEQHVKDFNKNRERYTIHNGRINSACEVQIVSSSQDATQSKLTHIPVKFGSILGDFVCVYAQITNTSFLPTHCDMLSLGNHSTLRKLDNLPRYAERMILVTMPLTEFPNIPGDDYIFINLNQTDITSLVGVDTKFSKHSSRNRELRMSYDKITEGGLGLILVDKLVTLSCVGDMPKPFQIIQKYLGQPDRIYECQNELIDNGLEEFAQL